jgi:hypothetical protein
VSARSRVEQDFDVTSFREAHLVLYRRELAALGQRSSGTRRIGPPASQ